MLLDFRDSHDPEPIASKRDHGQSSFDILHCYVPDAPYLDDADHEMQVAHTAYNQTCNY